MKSFWLLMFFPLLIEAKNFSQSKKYLSERIDLFGGKTIYCGCDIKSNQPKTESRGPDSQAGEKLKTNKRSKVAKDKKLSVDLKSCGYKIQSDKNRAERLEWEHVVPAEAFGQSFKEWHSGTANCVKRGKKFKGRKCAETNAEFRVMESDLYNLFPEVGELNGLRSNYSMAEISGVDGKFGSCSVKLEDRKFEPHDVAKGVVARTYLNFESRYPGRGVVSGKNEKLFMAWDKMHPVSELECRRWKSLEAEAGYPHLFVSRCS